MKQYFSGLFAILWLISQMIYPVAFRRIIKKSNEYSGFGSVDALKELTAWSENHH